MTTRRILFALAAAMAASACSSDGTGAGDVLVVAEVEIDPPGAGLVVGATQQLQATPRTSSGIPVPNRDVVWSSSDPDIATVSETGLVTAVSLGETNINARVDQVTGSVPVNVSPKPVATVTVEPSSATMQVGQTRQLSATVKASDGETLEGRTVDFESDDPAVATVSSTGLVTGVGPGATSVRAISEGKEAAASFTITPRPAVRLGFTTQPANGIAGNPLNPIRVAVQDDLGGTVPNATNAVTIALDENPGDATLTGTLTVNAVAGVATFEGLGINRPASGYRLRVTSGELSPAISNPFAIVSGPPASLAITTQPAASASGGAPLTRQPVIQLRDREGNNASQPGVQVTATLVGSGGTLAGTTTVATNASGTATFTNLRIDGGAGTYQLRFSAPDLTAVTSANIVVAPASLAIATQPAATASSGAPLAPQPAVRLADAGGNPVAQSGVVITASLVGSGATLSGSTSATTNGAGVATFSGLTLTGPPGTFRLQFSSSGLSAVTSNEIALGAGAPAELEMAVQPSGTAVSGLPFLVQPQVQLVDGAGTEVSRSGIAVTVSLAAGNGSLSGTLTVETNSSGRAQFSGLSIDGSGTHRLEFTSPGLTAVESQDITVILDVTPTPVSTVEVQPSDVSLAVGETQQLQVVLRGSDGSALSGRTVTYTSDNTAVATVSSSGLVTAVAAGATVIRATSEGKEGQSNITVTAPAPVATQLGFATQPTDGTVGVNLSTVRVAVLDAGGNPVTSGSHNVTIALGNNPGQAELSGTLTVTTTDGVATFDNLQLNAPGTGYTLRATSGTLTPATSTAFAVAAASAGSLSSLAIIIQPSSTAVMNVPFSIQPVIQLRDAAGRDVTLSGARVRASLVGAGNKELTGDKDISTNDDGRAVFFDLRIKKTGVFRIRFTTEGIPSVDSSNITVTGNEETA